VLSGLVVLVDDPIAGGLPRPDVDTERRDPEVVPNGTLRAAAVGDLLDLVEARDLVAHAPIIAVPSGSRAAKDSATRVTHSDGLALGAAFGAAQPAERKHGEVARRHDVHVIPQSPHLNEGGILPRGRTGAFHPCVD
jgi:hypothetical protein